MSSRGQKSRKQRRTRVNIVEKQSILTLFDFVFDFVGPGAERPHFRTLFPTLGPKGPNDPCSRSRASRLKRKKANRGTAHQALQKGGEEIGSGRFSSRTAQDDRSSYESAFEGNQRKSIALQSKKSVCAGGNSGFGITPRFFTPSFSLL